MQQHCTLPPSSSSGRALNPPASARPLCAQLGTTPFHSAAERGHLPVCQWLISLGVDPAAIDTFGRSALHYAAERGQLSVCTWLVEECGLSITSTTRVRGARAASLDVPLPLRLPWLKRSRIPPRRSRAVRHHRAAQRRGEGQARAVPLAHPEGGVVRSHGHGRPHPAPCAGPPPQRRPAKHVAHARSSHPTTNPAADCAAVKGQLHIIQWFVSPHGAARLACWRPAVVRSLLSALDVEGKTFMHWLMEKDDLHGAVGNLVRSHRSLADLSDRVGRLPIQVGTKACMAAVVKALLLYGRYKVKRGEPRHQSETSLVVYATDVQPQRDSRSGALRDVKRKLVLKYLRRREHFCRELEARAALEARLQGWRGQGPAPGRAAQPVLPLLGVHGSDGERLHPGCSHCPDLSAADLLADARALMNDFVSVDGESFLAEGAWCVVMEREDSTLRSAVHNEMLGAPMWERVRETAVQLAECLATLHAAGIVHGVRRRGERRPQRQSSRVCQAMPLCSVISLLR